MKNMSIRTKLVIVMFSIILGFIALLLVMNRLFLEDYYIIALKDDFEKEAALIVESSFSDNEEILVYLRNQNNVNGYKYIITDFTGRVIISSVPEFRLDAKQTLPKAQIKYMTEQLDEIKKHEMKYIVMRHSDEKNDQLMIFTWLSEDRVLIISDQLNDVRNNAVIANQFFIIIGGVVCLLVLIMTYFLSMKIVKPIVHLNKQTNRIANLDFEVSINSNSEDEIGQLSNNIKKLAASLDEKIKALNSANSLLKDDMVTQRQFLASIAHEFKSPIGIIKGYTESIQLKYYDNEEDKQTYLNYILEESDRLSALVEDVVMLAQLDKRDFRLHLSEVNITKVIEKSISKYRPLYEEKHISITNDNEPLTLKGDLIRIEQIVDNLLSNAHHYTPQNGVLEIVIKDNVIHFKNTCDFIEEEKLSMLIRPFYRLEDSRSRETGGHGLGLTIVEGLITAHGWHMEVSSKDNMFEVTIKL